MNIGLLGCGSMGKTFADAIARGDIPGANLKIIGDIITSDNYYAIASGHSCSATTTITDFLDESLDLVVEAASQQAAREHLPAIIAQGIDVMIMSIGIFADGETLEQFHRLAEEHDTNIYLPSGAIGGLDVISSAMAANLDKVTLTTTKHPASLERVRGEEVETYAHLQERTIIFQGNARKAAAAFPKNINVAAALSLAGLGPDKTDVVIVADPTTTTNTHLIEAQGDFGSFQARVENKPSPDNPRTSYLACLSGIAMLKKINSRIKVGS